MDLRQFRYFVAVAEELHFTRAAARLHIGQPPLSIQIKSIERELGTLLFNRTRRKVELTPAGELFLHEARLALLQASRAVDTVKRAARGELGTLRLNFITTLPLIEVFTSAIRAFRLALPEVHLELKIVPSVETIDNILLNTIDLGFTRPAIDTALPSSIVAIPIYEDRLMVVFPMDHPLNSGSGTIPISDLENERFILRKRGSGTGFYEQVYSMCAEAGFFPTIAQEATEASTTLGLVAAGVGITIAPEAWQRIQIPDMVWRELSGANVKSRVILIHNKTADNPLRDQFVARFEPIGHS